MSSKSTQFSSDNQPQKRKGRGKSERTKILESFKRMSKTEEDFYDLLAEKAFNPEDSFSYKELLNRLSPMPKATTPCIEFELDEKGSISQKAEQIIAGISKGEIPPDIGNQLIVSMSALMNIKEKTEFEERLKALESADQDS